MSKQKNSLPLSDDQQRWFEAARSCIDSRRLQKLIADLTSIHSPTGGERAASEFMVSYLRSIGIEAHYQAVSETSGNCIGRIRGTGGGPTLMLYAPIDTHLDARFDADVPWVGPALRADMVPQGLVCDNLVVGLGASNPKSMLCTLVEAAHSIVESGARLKGDILIAAGGGGMPWIVPERGNAGMSSGVMYMLSHGVAPDCGIIFKPGDHVYYEHPGLCWFKVTVRGSLGYAGLPRGIPGFRSSIVPAAKVILELEEWLTQYPDRHQSAQVRPEGWISAVRAGWPEKPALPSAATEIYIDVRTSPDQSNADLDAEFAEALRQITAKYPDVELDYELFATCKASRTDPDHWIVRSAVRAWEARHGVKYPGAPHTSGQTDAATITQMGIPLVRVGYPFAVDVPEEYSDGLGGMGVARISDLLGPCESVIYSVIDTCGRDRSVLTT